MLPSSPTSSGGVAMSSHHPGSSDHGEETGGAHREKGFAIIDRWSRTPVCGRRISQKP